MTKSLVSKPLVSIGVSLVISGNGADSSELLPLP
nr:MAG TPA: hypothetical protein [Caudoviricetes sp.]